MQGKIGITRIPDVRIQDVSGFPWTLSGRRKMDADPPERGPLTIGFLTACGFRKLRQGQDGEHRFCPVLLPAVSPGNIVEIFTHQTINIEEERHYEDHNL